MNKIMIGSIGKGKKIVMFSLNERQYKKFKKFCADNNYDFRIPFEKKNDKLTIICDKSVFCDFRTKFFYLFLKPFT
ncbi:MAG: hypothetical protein IJN43_10220 [Ruminococcus sp.]|nr:hypothetical protein [Ruminococcus sp.]